MPDSGDRSADRIIVDTYAWIEYFKGSEEGLKAKTFIEGRFELFTPAIVIAELSDKYRRECITEWETRNRFVKLRTKILALDENIADMAGELKQGLRKKHMDAGLADAIIFAHSLAVEARILTGDKHLKHVKSCISL